MTEALTSNTMIPANPGIAVQQAQAGAQVVTPPSAGAPPMVEPVQAPAPPAPEAYDFWSSVEKQVAPDQPQPLEQAPPPAQPPPVQAEPPAPPVVPEQPPVQPPAVAPPQEPMLTPEQQAALVEAGAAEAAVPPQQAPAPMQDFSAVEAQTIAHLARTEYALPEAEATRLVSEPEVVFPELAARLHVRLATQIGQAVQQILPSVIEQVVDGKMKAQALENDFFRSYPQLSDPRFKPVVAQSLRMARQASPQASRAQVMSDGAALAAMKLRLNMSNGGQQPVAAFQPPVQPPFQPATGGGVGLPILPQEPPNEFEVLANDPNW